MKTGEILSTEKVPSAQYLIWSSSWTERKVGTRDIRKCDHFSRCYNGETALSLSSLLSFRATESPELSNQHVDDDSDRGRGGEGRRRRGSEAHTRLILRHTCQTRRDIIIAAVRRYGHACHRQQLELDMLLSSETVAQACQAYASISMLLNCCVTAAVSVVFSHIRRWEQVRNRQSTIFFDSDRCYDKWCKWSSG